MRATVRSAAFLALLFCLGVSARCQPLPTPTPQPIRGAHYPALSPDGTRICFEYRGDLWTCDSKGGTATRLTVHPAYDAFPRWSPDGNWIAFSSMREGNFDVFIVPARGGEARQLTFHSADDIVQDWSPDGTHILFNSVREGRFPDLYALSVQDGRLRRLTNDRTALRYAVYSPDGRTIAFTRGGQAWWRPKYRGSQHTDIYTMPATGGAFVRQTRTDGWNAWPMYSGDGKRLYFVSQRDGASNLYVQLSGGGTARAVTHYAGDPVRNASIARDGSLIAYEQNFQIWTYRPAASDLKDARTAMPTPLRIFAPSDDIENATARVTMTSGASSVALSPDGKSIALALRGDIWTVKSEGGDAERLTRTHAMEDDPAWSPDSARLAYTSSRNGNLDIYVMDVKSKAEQQVTTDVADDENPGWSPDGQWLAFVRTGGSAPGLYVAPTASPIDPGKAVLVAPGPGITSYDWSPDGRWIAYAKRDATATTDIWIVPRVGGTPVNVTKYPGLNTSPLWTRDGRHLVFIAMRGLAAASAGPSIMALPLLPEPPRQNGGAEPAAQPDALAPAADADAPQAQRRRPPGTPQGSPPGMQGPVAGGIPPMVVVPRATEVRIEFDDIENRARPVWTGRDRVGQIGLALDGRTVVFATSGPEGGWWALDLVSGNRSRMTAPGSVTSGSDVGGAPQSSPDGARFIYRTGSGQIAQLSRGVSAPAPVAFSAVKVLDRRMDIAEAFNQAWRTLRTQFYDPRMHGTDWEAVRAKYEPLLGEVWAREDFAWLLQAMIGELNASHLGATPPRDPSSSSGTGYLGLTFDQDYPGPGLRVSQVMPKGPTDRPGKHVEVGEYVVAIDGQDVAFGEGLYRALQDRAGRDVKLLVNAHPTREGAREVTVRAVTKAAMDDLDYERWVAERRRKVDALSDGKLAYLHIRAMDQASLERFERELFGDAQSRQGLVLDIRFNPGGRIHDDLLAILTRRPHAYETPRDGERETQPYQVWARPIVLLINEFSASDAEIFPNGFRYYGLGQIVGVPTAGAVIGTRNITLIDGTTFRVPQTGWETVSGKPMENHGVQPDILVENTPEDNAADRDVQLETAVRSLLERMAKGK